LWGPISHGYDCSEDAGASTALGVSAEDLWRVYMGTYTVTAQRVSVMTGRPAETSTTELTVKLAPSQRELPESSECSAVIAPVQLSLRTDDESLDETGLIGSLEWLDYHGVVNFSSSITRSTLPRINGMLDIDIDRKLRVAFVVNTAREDLQFTNSQQEQEEPEEEEPEEPEEEP
jgi:hypothetical protein